MISVCSLGGRVRNEATWSATDPCPRNVDAFADLYLEGPALSCSSAPNFPQAARSPQHADMSLSASLPHIHAQPTCSTTGTMRPRAKFATFADTASHGNTEPQGRPRTLAALRSTTFAGGCWSVLFRTPTTWIPSSARTHPNLCMRSRPCRLPIYRCLDLDEPIRLWWLDNGMPQIMCCKRLASGMALAQIMRDTHVVAFATM